MSGLPVLYCIIYVIFKAMNEAKYNQLIERLKLAIELLDKQIELTNKILKT